MVIGLPGLQLAAAVLPVEVEQGLRLDPAPIHHLPMEEQPAQGLQQGVQLATLKHALVLKFTVSLTSSLLN